MRILLILPAAPHLRVSAAAGEVPSRSMLRFSVLPLTAVAGLTPPEHPVTICDENVQHLDPEAEVDLVGITFMTALAPRAYEIAALFRARGIPVVGGGFHPTLCPEDAAPHFDALVRGDAEHAWPRLLADVEAGRLRPLYENPAPCALEGTPPPRRELLAGTARHYVTTNAVQVGRGCPHTCRYCSIAAFHPGGYRRRSLEEVVAEVAGLEGDFMFVDDNIVGDPAFAGRLFRALAPLGKRWVGQSSLAVADDPKLLRLAAAAGCKGLFIGLETLDGANLAGVDKGFNRARDYRAQVRRIHRAGIGVFAGIIVGMDGDDPGVFGRTLRFLQRAGVDGLQLNIMTPLPGTPLHAEMERAGRITDRDWSHYDFRHCVIEPARMTARELQEGADWLYSQFYRLDRVVVRGLRTLVTAGLVPAWLTFRLGLTYRYDNLREGIRGRRPRPAPSARLRERLACP